MLRLAESPEDITYVNGLLSQDGLGGTLLGGEGPWDLTEAVACGVMVLFCQDGLVIAEPTAEPGSFVCHFGFLRTARGARAVIMARRMRDYLFTETSLRRIICTVSYLNTSAARVLHALGFTLREHACIIGELDYMGWAVASKACDVAGRSIEQRLWCLGPHARKQLGAFRLAVNGGWTGKALLEWSKFAQLYKLPDITPLDEDCSIFDLGGITFSVHDINVVG